MIRVMIVKAIHVFTSSQIFYLSKFHSSSYSFKLKNPILYEKFFNYFVEVFLNISVLSRSNLSRSRQNYYLSLILFTYFYVK